jgi:NAD dependent epimerase/dehydratase family enzyme
VLRRPTVLPTPLAPLKLLYGPELVQSLLLFSQRVMPAALQRTGYDFKHPALEAALRSVLQRPNR